MSEEETIQELSKINRMFASECDYLKNKLRKKENIIKEAREYIEEHIRIDDEYPNYMEMLLEEYKELLEILDKEKE